MQCGPEHKNKAGACVTIVEYKNSKRRMHIYKDQKELQSSKLPAFIFYDHIMKIELRERSSTWKHVAPAFQHITKIHCKWSEIINRITTQSKRCHRIIFAAMDLASTIFHRSKLWNLQNTLLAMKLTCGSVINSTQWTIYLQTRI